MPYFLFKGLLKEDLTHQSLYELLDARYNVHIAYVRREIEAVNAMESQSRLLKCAKNSALMKVVTTGYDTSRRPMEYSIAHYRGDRNRFTVTLCR